MINSVSIKDVATYGNNSEMLNDLSKINLIFGSNGSGKTTITRIIENANNFPSCKVNWSNGTVLQTMVYNRDFVSKNFHQSKDLKGIFTLGEKDIQVLNKIASGKIELDAMADKIDNLKYCLNGDEATEGKIKELENLESEFKQKCWAQKQKHDAKLSQAFEGLRNNAEKFKERILNERMANSSKVEELQSLEKRAATVFGPTPDLEKNIPFITIKPLIGHESNPILGKRVIGKEDVNIATMIQKLGNSDWIKEGRVFYENNDGICPFCQQSTTEAFAKSLTEYFDETFERDSASIILLENNYYSDSRKLLNDIVVILDSPSRYMNVEKLEAEKNLLASKISTNHQLIISKKKQPSLVIDLETVSPVLNSINALIDEANAKINDHNRLIENIAAERRELTSQVWKYIIDIELGTQLSEYEAKKNGLIRAINSISEQIDSSEHDRQAKALEIRKLEKETTSIQPTVDGINALLKSFGFSSFSIAKDTKSMCYKIIRPDGTDAKETLSEGEMSFVTFLYFYHLLKGSVTESGMTIDRVVVFDDPVSSLDSDILFIVGSLIRGIFEDVRSGTGHIKQIFVLTHNIYFHKEVTFNPKRRGKALSDETFWIVRKSGFESKLVQFDSNPIKTSYELLWDEVRKPDHSNLTIQNILRRILENYFRILGGISPDQLCNMFEGREKLICKSLFSWINDGSHNALEDLYMTSDGSIIDIYLRVFKAIFKKTGHLEHYNMMMGEETTSDELSFAESISK